MFNYYYYNIFLFQYNTYRNNDLFHISAQVIGKEALNYKINTLSKYVIHNYYYNDFLIFNRFIDTFFLYSQKAILVQFNKTFDSKQNIFYKNMYFLKLNYLPNLYLNSFFISDVNYKYNKNFFLLFRFNWYKIYLQFIYQMLLYSLVQNLNLIFFSLSSYFYMFSFFFIKKYFFKKIKLRKKYYKSLKKRIIYKFFGITLINKCLKYFRNNLKKMRNLLTTTIKKSIYTYYSKQNLFKLLKSQKIQILYFRFFNKFNNFLMKKIKLLSFLDNFYFIYNKFIINKLKIKLFYNK